jgi:acyl carrier protein
MSGVGTPDHAGRGAGVSRPVLDEVRRIAADVFELDVTSLGADSSPGQVETWDSLRHLNLVVALEAKYGIEFAPEEMERMETLGDIAALVGSKLR